MLSRNLHWRILAIKAPPIHNLLKREISAARWRQINPSRFCAHLACAVRTNCLVYRPNCSWSSAKNRVSRFTMISTALAIIAFNAAQRLVPSEVRMTRYHNLNCCETTPIWCPSTGDILSTMSRCASRRQHTLHTHRRRVGLIIVQHPTRLRFSSPHAFTCDIYFTIG